MRTYFVWYRNETAKLKEEVKIDSMRACMAEHAMEEAQNREAKYVFIVKLKMF